VEQLQNPQGLAQRQEHLESLWSLMAADRVSRLAFVEQVTTNRAGVDHFALLELWAAWLRDVMLMQAGCLDSCSNVDHSETIRDHARSLAPQQVQGFMRTLQRVNEMLHHTVNVRLALDVLVLRLPYLPR
jgi:DNA polymerase-3 subunit delta'